MLATIGRSCLVVCAVFGAAAWAGAAEREGRLSDEQRELLDGVLRTFLYDPPERATCVEVSVTRRSVWAHEFEADAIGWQVGERVFLVDGHSVLVPADAEAPAPFDLEALDPSAERPPIDPYVAAAWLYRREREDLAAAFLARVETELAGELARLNPHLAPTVANLRAELAWEAFAGMVHAYMVRADEEALAHGERLLRLYPAEADAGWPQARHVLKELRRRERAGRLGAAPRAPPEDLGDRPVAEQVAWWIDALEDVDARQFSQPGGVHLGSDHRVAGLVRLGDPAVPALIDALEGDERLTRSVHFWRDFSRHRTVLSVREAALAALEAILRVELFLRASTGDSLSAREPEEARRIAGELREYWAEHGDVPLEERLRRELVAPETSSDALRAAARALAELGEGAVALEEPTAAEAILDALERDLARHALGPASLGVPLEGGIGEPLRVGALPPDSEAWRAGLRRGDVVERVDGQVVDGAWLLEQALVHRAPGEAVEVVVRRAGAEETLTLRLVPRPPDEQHFGPSNRWGRGSVHEHYLEALVVLGDERVEPALAAAWAEASDPADRRRLALTCHALGNPAPLGHLAEQLREGRLEPPPAAPGEGEPGDPGDAARDDPEVAELNATLRALIRAGGEAADRALFAVARPGHPYHEATAGLVRESGGFSPFEQGLLEHPFALRFLVRDLDDVGPDGSTYRLRDGQLVTEHGDGGTSWSTPPPWLDSDRARDVAVGRVCDRAALRLAESLVGLPNYHPLLEERDLRLAALREVARRYAPNARRLEDREAHALGLSPGWGARFLPDVRPLGRPANATDVEAGRAIFALPEGGTPLDLNLPYTGALRRDGAEPLPVLVLQAERAPDGAAHYGVVGPDLIGPVPAEGLAWLRPFPDPEAQREAARAFLEAISARDLDAVERALAPASRDLLEAHGGLEAWADGMRDEIERDGADVWIEHLAPRFRQDEDGGWRVGWF